MNVVFLNKSLTQRSNDWQQEADSPVEHPRICSLMRIDGKLDSFETQTFQGEIGLNCVEGELGSYQVKPDYRPAMDLTGLFV